MRKQILKRIAEKLSKNIQPGNKKLPSLFFFSDRRKFEDIFSVFGSMPDFVAIVVREYDLDTKSRLKFAQKIKKIAGRKLVLIGKDLDLALKIKADGVHFSDLDPQPNYFDYRKRAGNNFIFTCSCHRPCSVTMAEKNNLNAVFYSPIFPTPSHKKAKTIGILKLAKIATRSRIPLYALGGINQKNYHLLVNSKIRGLAGISMFN